jgi:hypothetical protein
MPFEITVYKKLSLFEIPIQTDFSSNKKILSL